MTVPRLIPYAGKERRGSRTGLYYGKMRVIECLWRAGLDTVDISKRVVLSEAAVANALIDIRDEGRA